MNSITDLAIYYGIGDGIQATSADNNNKDNIPSLHSVTCPSDSDSSLNITPISKESNDWHLRKPNMFCVFLVDVEDSSRVTANMPPKDYTRYYSLFYNLTSQVVKDFGGTPLKFMGDSILFYYPATSSLKNESAFVAVLQCGSKLINSRGKLNEAFHKEGLPGLSFRISADYGRMDLIDASDLTSIVDFVSPSMNMVAKMNRLASSDMMAIGGDLYQVIDRLGISKSYSFAQSGEVDIGMKQKYPVYHVVKEADNGPKSKTLQSGDSVAEPRSKSFSEFIQHENHPATQPSTNSGQLQAVQQVSNVKAACKTKEQKMNILVVDDEPDIVLTYKEYLEGPNFRVEGFSDPAAAISRFMEAGPFHFDVVILDIRMHPLNGLQLCRIMKSLNPIITVLFATALDAAEEVISIIRDVSSRDILRKPIERSMLIGAIDVHRKD